MTTTVNPETMTAFLDKDLLGEGPYWLPDRGLLSRVDIHGGDLVICDPVTGEHRRHHVGAPAAFAIPRRTGGFVMGVGLEVKLFDSDLNESTLLDLGSELAENRFNDAVCDSRGRLWAGTMSTRRPRELGTGEASLFRIDPDGAHEEVLTGLTLSNGMDWLDDGHTLLHVDSDAHRIDRYDVDVDHGRVSGRSTFVQFDPDIGLPDGLTVDSDGGVWIAFFYGGQVRRYDSRGREDVRYMMPVSAPTSVMLGGSDLRDLYVTTSSHRLTHEEAAVQQLAGSVLRIRVSIPGLPQHHFGG